MTIKLAQHKVLKMKSAVICISLYIILLCANVSFSTTITDCLCTIRSVVPPKIILICDNEITPNKSNSQYYSCYNEIFTNGAVSVDSLKTDNFCKGSTLDPGIPATFKGLTEYDISYHGIESLSPDELRFSGLFRLNASHNNLQHIQVGLFKYAPELFRVDLNFNNIMVVEAGVFFRANQTGAIV